MYYCTPVFLVLPPKEGILHISYLTNRIWGHTPRQSRNLKWSNIVRLNFPCFYFRNGMSPDWVFPFSLDHNMKKVGRTYLKPTDCLPVVSVRNQCGQRPVRCWGDLLRSMWWAELCRPLSHVLKFHPQDLTMWCLEIWSLKRWLC